MTNSPSSTNRKTVEKSRAPRPDGDTTKAKILNVAGRLFAEFGYAQTTSKMICEAAHTNIAAVNYHFGSREDLYLAVLREVHQHMLSLDYMSRLADSEMTSHEKLDQLIDGICVNLLNGEDWQKRLWARELLAPSKLMAGVLEMEVMPKFDMIRQIVAEVINRQPCHPVTVQSTLSVMSPVLVLLVLNRDLPGPAQMVREGDELMVAAHMKTFLWAGLQAVKAASFEGNHPPGPDKDGLVEC
ncbi:TetR/AcrR family transcriptional regulator [Sodalis sp. dw_96]|uniref:TetR/AcrR family transcriptional regulator n=1 Tax=Sodalis sp. dw_96 TaxID=2719794 RepID=UPI001BD1F554|nr:TetR/AcrR family transcriptional regulator [Sodalis sp. dw_96]